MHRIISSFLFLLLLLSCSTGKKALERGDYYAATLQAVHRLRSNPDSKKALAAIRDSYPMALKYYQGRIDYALQSGGQFRYSEIVDYYEKMNRMSDEISRCPAALNLFPSLNYYTYELVQAKEKAAEEQYSAALAYEKLNTRESWKEAYFCYQRADRFVSAYKDVRLRMQVAKSNATLKVIVEQIPVPRNYQITSDFFLEQILEALSHDCSSEFVEYFSPESAQNAGIKSPDQVLRMNFDDFTIGQIYDKETVKELSRDSVVVGTYTLPNGTKKNVYNTVKAKLTSYRREVISKGLLDVTITGVQLNNIIQERKFPGQFVWFTEWGFFNGDERALTKDQLAMCNRKPVSPPDPQQLFIEFTKPIYSQVVNYLRSFYSSY
jgi:tetratricopeptide (TPR) repeat protein